MMDEQKAPLIQHGNEKKNQHAEIGPHEKGQPALFAIGCIKTPEFLNDFESKRKHQK